MRRWKWWISLLSRGLLDFSSEPPRRTSCLSYSCSSKKKKKKIKEGLKDPNTLDEGQHYPDPKTKVEQSKKEKPIGWYPCKHKCKNPSKLHTARKQKDYPPWSWCKMAQHVQFSQHHSSDQQKGRWKSHHFSRCWKKLTIFNIHLWGKLSIKWG